MKTLIKTLSVAACVALALKTRVIVIKRKDDPEPTVLAPYKPQSEDLPRWNELTKEEQERFSRALNKVITGGTDIYAPLRVLRNIQKERKNKNG